MNPTYINLKELTYHSQIKLVDFGFSNYMLFNQETNAYLYHDNTKGICFCDDYGEHFVYKGAVIFEIETDTQNHFLDRGQSKFIEDLNITFHNCNSWSEVYFQAVFYFTLFAE